MKKALLFTGILALATGFACHKRKHKSPSERAEWLVQRIEKKLSLDESQSKKLNEIKDELLAKHKSQAARMQDDLKTFAQKIRAESISKNEISPIVDARRKQREAFESFLLDKVLEFHKILKPEQREKAAVMVEEFSSRFMRKH